MSTPTPKTTRWRIITASEKGPSHQRDGRPNQDSIAYHLSSHGESPVILAVSDGHGSEKCFRSQFGSRIAADTCVDICREFVEGMANETPTSIKRSFEKNLASRIIAEWRKRVMSHLAQNPFTEVELEFCCATKTTDLTDHSFNLLPYGATLIGLVLTDSYMISFQLGDGDAIEVSESTTEPELLIPKDESNIANDTNSLCQEKACSFFRSKFHLLQEKPPAFVMLSTDGYSNSFSTYDGYLQAGKDLFQFLTDYGYQYVERSIHEWIADASSNGSGDDTTIGLLIRDDLLPESEQLSTQDFEVKQVTPASITKTPKMPILCCICGFLFRCHKA